MSNKNKHSGNGPWSPIDQAAASDKDIQRVHEELAEQRETPRAGFSPIPIFLVFLLSALIVFSAIYMVLHSDDFDALGFVETRTRARDAWSGEAVVVETVDPFLQRGMAVYMQTCAACHQQNGQGLPGAFPTLHETRWVIGSKERVIRIVMHGMMGPIEVRGQTYTGVMPNFGLPDEDIAAVLTYVRQEWGNSASAVSVEEVAQVRAEEGQRASWTAEELLQLFPMEDPAELQQAEEAPAEEEAP